MRVAEVHLVGSRRYHLENPSYPKPHVGADCDLLVVSPDVGEFCQMFPVPDPSQLGLWISWCGAFRGELLALPSGEPSAIPLLGEVERIAREQYGTHATGSLDVMVYIPEDCSSQVFAVNVLQILEALSEEHNGRVPGFVGRASRDRRHALLRKYTGLN